jgi:hypothetical protein
LNDYDEYILAGASLGYLGLGQYDWRQSFEDHIDIAYELHDIHKIVIVDHMNCGAYKVQYPTLIMGSIEEYQQHVINLRVAKEQLILKYEDKYEIETYILSIDGCTLTQIV